MRWDGFSNGQHRIARWLVKPHLLTALSSSAGGRYGRVVRRSGWNELMGESVELHMMHRARRIVRQLCRPLVAAALLLLVVSADARAQAPAAWRLGYGILHIRMLGASSVGGEFSVQAPVPLTVLGGALSVNSRVWGTELGGSNAWMNELRVFGLGVSPTVTWCVLGSPVRADVEMPVEIVHVGTPSMERLDRRCVLVPGGKLCELGGSDTALSIGFGGGLSLALYDTFYVGTGFRGWWSGIERVGASPTWVARVGFGIRWGTESGGT